MEKSSFASGAFLRSIGSAIICLALSGCLETIPVLKTKSDTELAIAEVKTEWLKKCESLADPMPENEIGGLLQDYAKLAVLYAECMKRNHALIDYLQPIVSKERGATQ